MFFVSLAIGLFYIYISSPVPKVIYIYPTPDNVHTIQYKDQASNCFAFDTKEVSCPKGDKNVKRVPIQ